VLGRAGTPPSCRDTPKSPSSTTILRSGQAQSTSIHSLRAAATRSCAGRAAPGRRGSAGSGPPARCGSCPPRAPRLPRILLRTAVPRRPGWRATRAARGVASERRSASACSMARSSRGRSRIAARSSNVRATVVVGMPSISVISSGATSPRWARMPSHPPSLRGTVTSVRTASPRRRPHSTAAERWLSTAFGPQARTPGHPDSRPGQASPTDGIDTMMHREQPSLLQSMANRPPTHAEVHQLISGDRAMLSVGDLGDQKVPRPKGTSGPTAGLDIPVAVHSPIVARCLRPRGRRRNESATLVPKA
jgi:hypothetical protein